MTRAERAAEQVRKAKAKAEALERTFKAKIAEQRVETRRVEAVLSAAVRNEDHKRRYHVGALAQDAGLFAWSNTDLGAVFAVLARLKDVPHPAAVLEGMLGENGVNGHRESVYADCSGNEAVSGSSSRPGQVVVGS